MAEEASAASTSSYQVATENAESPIKINVKTLDSKIYTVLVDKDTAVPALKAKLADITGVPVERQRLIFRGKVLKDDHLLSEYQFEDGHTLHLVARQPVEGQSSSGTAQDDNSQGNASSTGAVRNRIGQVQHSVLLGTVNVADQGGDTMISDIGRIVGTVLGSLGLGTGAPIGNASVQPSDAASAPNAEAEGNRNTTGSQMSGNPSISFQSLNQVPQFPSTEFLSPNMTIPDSLTTLSEFIGRMEVALQSSGTHSSPNNVRDPLQADVRLSNARGLPTPEMLQMVMEQAQQLLRVNTSDALSRVSMRLGREGNSTDPTVRGEIQAEAKHLGRAMQHLGAMLLELGRTMMTIRLGQSPADAVVNAGPAVYISPSGPNPIMVQPVPSQTNSLFGISSPLPVFGVSGSVHSGDPSRNVSIHIHAGNPLSSGVSNGQERANAQHANRDGNNTNNNSAGNTASTQRNPSRTVVTAIPARPITQTSGNVLSVIYPVHVRSQLSVPIPSTSAQVPNQSSTGSDTQPTPTFIPQIVAQINAQLANMLSVSGQGTTQVQSSITNQGNQTPSETGALSVSAQQDPPDSSSSDLAQDVSSESTASIISDVPCSSMSKDEKQTTAHENSNKLSTDDGLSIDVNSSTSAIPGGTTVNLHNEVLNDRSFETTPKSNVANLEAQSSNIADNDRPAPLGLGLGGLQPKKRGKTTKPAEKNTDQSIARGQQILQTLVSQRSDVDRNNANRPSNPQTSLFGQITNNLPMGKQGTDEQGQVDAADMMSQILRTPAFNNLLTGVAASTGIGSSSDLRSMLEQCTQNPVIRNTLNDIAQQEGEAQSGGLDFSRMIQQMMPAVSQALGSGLACSPPNNSLQPTVTESRSNLMHERDSQVDLEHVVEGIEQQDSPGNIFRSLLESAGHLLGEGDNIDDLLSSLGNNEDLTTEFTRMLGRDLNRRIQKDSTSEG